MDGKQFETVLDFAIEREKEAVKFYNDLIKRAKSFDLMETIRSIELMERDHIRTIGKMREQQVGDLVGKPVDDMKIGEYLIAPQDEPTDEYQDLLIIAMKREELSYNLYRTLAEEMEDPALKKVFQKLASEEAKHKLTFERLYDSDILKKN